MKTAIKSTVVIEELFWIFAIILKRFLNLLKKFLKIKWRRTVRSAFQAGESLAAVSKVANIKDEWRQEAE